MTKPMLVIWEDNSVWQQAALDDDIKRASHDGLCQVFRFVEDEFLELTATDPEEWLPVKEYESSKSGDSV